MKRGKGREGTREGSMEVKEREISNLKSFMRYKDGQRETAIIASTKRVLILYPGGVFPGAQ
jgi:hypothetical protein